MNTKEIVEQAILLKPNERFLIIDCLLKSLDEPDKKIDELWMKEAGKRLKSYRSGALQGFSMESIFSD